eukprot:CAMPEP_0173106988 /NCGR_PEP_ID=MMETSP1102-20130122/41456_1 /TAXON_ID=49646 /ORGANISM="Geminigera sp., Strain Caron Lab Isolate" /LENGTH=223 /DNA_ID=CAMNT_0014004385 /DNA_START=168 /DNA_END=840 /DNA_ORIENTATION=-
MRLLGAVGHSSDEEELERFAKSTGGRFPLPQTTKGGAMWTNKPSNVGVVLLGDALHAFPPDLGQGVNSALKDVSLLGDGLRNATTNSVKEGTTSGGYSFGNDNGRDKLGSALRSYEIEATGEATALVRLMQLGSPYQYNQPGFRAQVAAKLMAANLLLRLVLSQIPFLGNTIFFPQIAMLSQLSGSISYREMLSRAHRTSFAFAAVGIMVALACIKAFLGGGM